MFDDLDVNSNKLGGTVEKRNAKQEDVINDRGVCVGDDEEMSKLDEPIKELGSNGG